MINSTCRSLLKLHSDTTSALNSVTAYGPGFVEINKIRFDHAIAFGPEAMSPAGRTILLTSPAISCFQRRGYRWHRADPNGVSRF